MTNRPFLRQVAEYYVNSGADLSQYTFVLPNKRSAMFLRMYLKASMNRVSFMPRLVTITYFTQQYCDRVIASDTELLFILYNVYCEVLRRHERADQIRDFDSFVFWGAILLSDFNDVDSYMADAHQLFKNVKDEHEISANYLTPEQIEVANWLCGISIPVDQKNFWRHMPSEPTPEGASDKFLNLWEILAEVYDDFNTALSDRSTPLAYSGLQSKLACQKIRNMSADEFDGQRYAFIGFNALPTSRVLIFQRLKDLGIADFFWDTASPFLLDKRYRHSRAGRFVMPLSRKFPSPDGFELDPITTRPQIDIVPVPSNIGQTKAAAQTIAEWQASAIADGANKVETGIVLADTHLLLPMLYSIPADITPINVTMGVPYQNTPFANLLDAIMTMHHRARFTPDVNYLAVDVDEVLSYQHVSMINPAQVARIKEQIASMHLFHVSAKELHELAPDLDFIFKPINNEKATAEVQSYLLQLIDGMYDIISAHSASPDAYELIILRAYRMAIQEIARLTLANNIVMVQGTFYTLLRKTLASLEIQFNGNPVRGLQLMDIMDARMLDFENLIILSMNERIFPRKNPNPSLIPASLRNAYNLPTTEDQESTSAYQFYRLISRATRISLMYDSRTSGTTSGEMSRYLSQLIHLPQQADISMREIALQPQALSSRLITINKTPDVLAELQKFHAGGPFNLSASALKSYIVCPLKFYLQYVKKMKLEDNSLEYMDPASYGTILHEVAQVLYEEHSGAQITPQVIEQMLKRPIEDITLGIMNRIYYHNRFKNIQNIPGEGQILSKIIAKYIREMLKNESRMGSFVFLKAEDKAGQKVHHWRITDDYTVNFTMSIDRVDQLDDHGNMLRFIDYKTGGDKLEAGTIGDLFTDKELGGFFQVLAYCLAYCEITGYRGAIQPMIYSFVKMPTDGIQPLTLKGPARGSRIPIMDFRTVQDEYATLFRDLIHRILEPDNAYPFCQTDNVEHCKYCPYMQMCGRF